MPMVAVAVAAVVVDAAVAVEGSAAVVAEVEADIQDLLPADLPR